MTLWNGNTIAVTGPSGTVDGFGKAHGATGSYYGAYFTTMADCECNWGNYTFDVEPSETSLQYFLYTNGGDGCCGGTDEPPCM